MLRNNVECYKKRASQVRVILSNASKRHRVACSLKTGLSLREVEPRQRRKRNGHISYEGKCGDKVEEILCSCLMVELLEM